MRLKAFSWHCHANARPHFPFPFLLFTESLHFAAASGTNTESLSALKYPETRAHTASASMRTHSRTCESGIVLNGSVYVARGPESVQSDFNLTRGITGVKPTPEGKFVILFATQSPLQRCQPPRVIQIPERPAGLWGRQPEQDIIIMTLWLFCCYFKPFQRLTLKLKSKGCK